MDSLAITDHGKLHGPWQFYREARAGARSGPSSASRPTSRSATGTSASDPLPRRRAVLPSRTAREETAPATSISSALVHRILEWLLPPAAIDREVLERYSDGLIGLAACLSARSALYCGRGTTRRQGKRSVFRRVFGRTAFWLEVQDHGLADENRHRACSSWRGSWASGRATNDAHYLRKEDAEAHDVLLAIGTGKDLDDPNASRFFGQRATSSRSRR